MTNNQTEGGESKESHWLGWVTLIAVILGGIVNYWLVTRHSAEESKANAHVQEIEGRLKSIDEKFAEAQASLGLLEKNVIISKELLLIADSLRPALKIELGHCSFDDATRTATFPLILTNIGQYALNLEKPDIQLSIATDETPEIHELRAGEHFKFDVGGFGVFRPNVPIHSSANIILSDEVKQPTRFKCTITWNMKTTDEIVKLACNALENAMSDESVEQLSRLSSTYTAGLNIPQEQVELNRRLNRILRD